MTLKGLKDYLAGLTWVDRVLDHADYSNPEDVEKYGISNIHVFILEKSGLVAKKRTIHCYVVGLGSKDELAYFDGRIPMPELAPAVKTEYVANADGTVYESKSVVALTGEEKVIAEKADTLEAVAK